MLRKGADGVWEIKIPYRWFGYLFLLLLVPVVVIGLFAAKAQMDVRASQQAFQSASDTASTAFAPGAIKQEPYRAAPTTEPLFAGIPAGHEGHLDSGAASVFVASDESAYKEMQKFANANDLQGIAQMMLDSRVFNVKSGSRIKVVENKLLTVRVRVLDGANEGVLGWAAAEFVKN